MSELGQPIAVATAFWIAVLGFRRRAVSRRDAAVYLVGLLLGAALTHVGWVALNLPALAPDTLDWLFAPAGFTVLLLPLGFVGVAWLAEPGFLGRAFSSLPLALAAARVGCIPASCCRGEASAFDLYSLVGITRHPVEVLEIVGWVLVWRWLLRLQPEQRAGAFLLAFGGLRLVLEPFRVDPFLGTPSIPVEWLAAPLSVAGMVMLFLNQTVSVDVRARM